MVHGNTIRSIVAGLPIEIERLQTVLVGPREVTRSRIGSLARDNSWEGRAIIFPAVVEEELAMATGPAEATAAPAVA